MSSSSRTPSPAKRNCPLSAILSATRSGELRIRPSLRDDELPNPVASDNNVRAPIVIGTGVRKSQMRNRKSQRLYRSALAGAALCALVGLALDYFPGLGGWLANF